MTRRNRQLEIAITLFLAFVLFACGASQRKTTLKTTYNAVTVAEKSFVAWDKQYQQGIIDTATSAQDGLTKLEAYRRKRSPVESAFVAAYRTIATALFIDNDETLTGAMMAWTALKDALAELTDGKVPL